MLDSEAKATPYLMRARAMMLRHIAMGVEPEIINPMRADKCPAEGKVVELGTAIVVEGWLDGCTCNEVTKWAKGGTSVLGPHVGQ